MEQLQNPNNPTLTPTQEFIQTLATYRPMEQQRVWGQAETEPVPADAAGRLELEIYLLGAEAQKYDPDTHMGQRLQMAAQVRGSALNALEMNDNNPKVAIRALKQEKREALRAGDIATVENTQREISVLKRVKSLSYVGAENAVFQLTELNRDPQFSEKGLFRQLGSLVKRSVVATPKSVSRFDNSIKEGLRSPSVRENHRKQVARSIQERNSTIWATRQLREQLENLNEK